MGGVQHGAGLLQDRPPLRLERCPMALGWSLWTRGSRSNRTRAGRRLGDSLPVTFVNCWHLLQMQGRKGVRQEPRVRGGGLQVEHHTAFPRGGVLDPHCRSSPPSEPADQDVSPGPPSPVHPAGPSEAPRPPAPRVKPGVWEMRPHELSAIPEVETSLNPSLDLGQRHPPVTILESTLLASGIAGEPVCSQDGGAARGSACWRNGPHPRPVARTFWTSPGSLRAARAAPAFSCGQRGF